jgi:hypothetical protein
MKFRGRCWRRWRYREQNLLERIVNDKEYSFRGSNLEDVAGDSLRAPGREPLERRSGPPDRLLFTVQ